jgi:hypothetical protein
MHEDDEEEGEEEGGEDEFGDEESEEGEDDEEIVLTFGQLKQALAPFIGGEEGGEEDEYVTSDDANLDEDDLDEDDLEEDDLEERKPKVEERKHHHKVEERKKMEERKHKKEIEEAKKAIEELRGSLHEVNLLNAKLLYMNKIFKAKSLNESQKKRVVTAFDRASNVKEVKNIFATLNESISAPKKQLRESYNGFASKPAGYAPKQNITEADPFVTRMQQLAGIKKY